MNAIIPMKTPHGTTPKRRTTSPPVNSLRSVIHIKREAAAMLNNVDRPPEPSFSSRYYVIPRRIQRRRALPSAQRYCFAGRHAPYHAVSSRLFYRPRRATSLHLSYTLTRSRFFLPAVSLRNAAPSRTPSFHIAGLLQPAYTAQVPVVGRDMPRCYRQLVLQPHLRLHCIILVSALCHSALCWVRVPRRSACFMPCCLCCRY